MSYIAPLWKAYNESPSRVPMTDWYDTLSGRIVSFQHRTVQGGLFMRVLLEAWKDMDMRYATSLRKKSTYVLFFLCALQLMLK